MHKCVPFVRAFAHSFPHSLFHLINYLFTSFYTQSLILLVVPWLTCSFNHFLNRSLTHSFDHQRVYSFIHFQFLHSFVCWAPPPGADFQGTGIGPSILPFLFFISEVVVWLRSSTLCAGCFPGSRDITSNDCTLTFISILCQDNSSSFPFYLSHFSGFQLAQT